METTKKVLECQMCGFDTNKPYPQDLGEVKGNTERYRNSIFKLWKCPECLTIVSIDPVDFHDIYSDYPLNRRKLDIFAKGTLKNLFQRLENAGIKTTDSILDYGCGNGIFINYLKQKGYKNVVGYDPYVSEYSDPLKDNILFDFIINNDTLEHCDDINKMVQDNLNLLKEGGFLYLGTADSEPVEMNDLEPHIMRLHQPYHRIILTEQSLHKLVKQYPIDVIASYRRSYHDTKRPFSSYRFLDELNKALGHNLDLALDSSTTSHIFIRSPRLWFFAFFGYWFPTANEPAVVLRKEKS